MKNPTQKSLGRVISSWPYLNQFRNKKIQNCPFQTCNPRFATSSRSNFTGSFGHYNEYEDEATIVQSSSDEALVWNIIFYRNSSPNKSFKINVRPSLIAPNPQFLFSLSIEVVFPIFYSVLWLKSVVTLLVPRILFYVHLCLIRHDFDDLYDGGVLTHTWIECGFNFEV